jgi:hypothetical protein
MWIWLVGAGASVGAGRCWLCWCWLVHWWWFVGGIGRSVDRSLVMDYWNLRHIFRFQKPLKIQEKRQKT